MRNAIIFLKKRKMSLFLSSKSQSSQVVSLSWFHGLLLPSLRIHEFIAGAEHRSSVRDHQDCEEILDLLLSQPHHFRRHILIAFPSAVPAQIVVGPVGIVLAIGQVMLIVVGDQIVKAKAVVRSDVIDALSWVVRIVEIIGKQITATIDPGHEVANFSRVTFDERANVVAIFAIPLAP